MPDENPVSFASLFALWPSPAALAADMGVPVNRARQWIRREALDHCYWPQLIRSLKSRGTKVSYEDLIAASGKQKDTRIDACRRSARTRREAKGLDRQDAMLARLCALGHGTEEITDMINEAFGTTLGRAAIRSRLKRLGLRASTAPAPQETSQGAAA